jgi:hypothetical protein
VTSRRDFLLGTTACDAKARVPATPFSTADQAQSGGGFFFRVSNFEQTSPDQGA